MITAIVLIQTGRGETPDVAQELLKIPDVSEVYSVAGEYDLVAVLRVKEYSDMADVVPGKLQRVEGIERTETMMAFQCFSRHDLDRLFAIGMDEDVPAEADS